MKKPTDDGIAYGLLLIVGILLELACLFAIVTNGR